MKRAADETTTNSSVSTKKQKSDGIPLSPPTRESSSSSSSTTTTNTNHLPKNVNLKVGSKIEVQWDINDPETDDIVSAWFVAEYMGPVLQHLKKNVNSSSSSTTTTTTSSCKNIEIIRHKIKYEPRDNFPEVISECIFLSNSRLLDCGEEDTLLWRKEGEAWIVDELDEEFGQCLKAGETTSENEVIMTMGELLQDQQHMDNSEHGGNSLADMGVRAMGRLPYMQQVQIVSNYQNFSSALKSKLESIQNERGAGALVTEADIKSFMADLGKGK